MAMLDIPHTMYGPSITGQYLIQPHYSASHGRPYHYRDYELQVQQAHQAHKAHQARLHASPPGAAVKYPPHSPTEHLVNFNPELQSRLHGGVKEEQGQQTAFKPYSPGQENLPGQGNVPSKVFASKADLQLHTQVHMREPKPYKCSQCSKSFANSSYLSQHMRIHLGIKPYRCEICQRKFTQLSHLQQHIRTHTGDKPYKCRHPGCTKAFSQLSNLQSHSRCHQTDKPYKCNSCYKCFHDEVSLLEHIPKHKESKHLKTHICSYCGKSYTQETYLAKHMQKHADRTDKRPPIVAEGTSNPTTPMGHLGSPTEHSYWPKMDGYGYGHQLMEQRLPDPREYDPRGLHPGNPHQGLMQEELRHHQHLASASGWGEHGPTSPNPAVPKSSSSAFSPLQSSMLHSAAIHSASPGFGMGNPRGYAAFYDPIAFSSQAPTKVNFGEPSTSTASNTGFAGPQLLSLSKIKNYAHNPHNDGLFKSLSSLSQDKPVHQLGQAAQ